MEQQITPEIAEQHGFKGNYYPGEGWVGKCGDINLLLPHGYMFLKWNRIPGAVYTTYQLETLLNIYAQLKINAQCEQPKFPADRYEPGG